MRSWSRLHLPLLPSSPTRVRNLVICWRLMIIFRIFYSKYCGIASNVRRNDVEKLVRELMDGEKGMKMKKNVMDLKSKAEEAYKLGGYASKQLDKLINDVLLQNS
ncbi:UDP-glycosyltransferase 85A8, partial [Cucurbita argyrosperma subsp. sororia]